MKRPRPCAAEPDAFYALDDLDLTEPSDVAAARVETAEVAKLICREDCDERLDCLARALEAGERWGIWGGLDPAERRKIGVPA